MILPSTTPPPPTFNTCVLGGSARAGGGINSMYLIDYPLTINCLRSSGVLHFYNVLSHIKHSTTYLHSLNHSLNFIQYQLLIFLCFYIYFLFFTLIIILRVSFKINQVRRKHVRLYLNSLVFKQLHISEPSISFRHSPTSSLNLVYWQ